MLDFLLHLLDTTDFPERWSCGNWSTAHGWLHVGSDVATSGAYIAIPVVMGSVVIRRHRDVAFPRLFWLFAAFIFACGIVHLIEAGIFWWPVYRLSGLFKLITAVVSWATVVTMVRVSPQAVRLPGLAALNQELEAEIESRRRAEERLRLVLESMSDGVIVATAGGRLEMFNRAAQDMVGLGETEADVSDWSGTYRIYEADGTTEHPAGQLPLARALRGEIVTGQEVVVRNPTRTSSTWLSCRATPLRDEQGNISGGVVVFHDVTDLREHEQEREATAIRVRRITETAVRMCETFEDSDASFFPAVLRKVRQATGSPRGCFGYRTENGGMIWTAGSRPPGAGRQPGPAPDSSAVDRLVQRQETYLLNTPHATPLGDRFVCGVGVPIVHEREFLGAIVIGDAPRTYVSEDLELLGQLASMIAPVLSARLKLKLESAERQRAENRAGIQQRKLEHLSRTNTLGELTTTLAHELNQPLSAITTYAVAGGDALRDGDSGEAIATFGKIREQGIRAGEIIRRIRGLVRPHAADRTMFDIIELVRETLELVRADLRREDVDVSTEFDRSEVPCNGDRVQIQQVLLNVIRNAAEAVSACDDRDVGIRVSRTDDGVVIAVSDSGHGITRSDAEDLFKSFFTTKTDGLGIGLKICRSIVEAHGGHIRATNNPSVGATFVITLPATHHTETLR